MYKPFLVLFFALFFGFANQSIAAGAGLLTPDSYAKAGAEKAVVLLHVNWGRQWKCAKLDNAQLQALGFSRLPSTETSLSLENPSPLTAKDSFSPYAYLVDPGRYALSSFHVRAALSAQDVQNLKAGSAQLFKDGSPTGGSFSVEAGDVVYLGHFGLDCKREAVPWRYYIEGRKDFENYVQGLKKTFPFLKEKPVQYRLFSTTMFGHAYALD